VQDPPTRDECHHDMPVGPGTEEPYHGVIVATPAWVAPSPPREITTAVSFSLGSVRFEWCDGAYPHRLTNRSYSKF
jgi:hypothetical protein